MIFLKKLCPTPGQFLEFCYTSPAALHVLFVHGRKLDPNTIFNS